MKSENIRVTLVHPRQFSTFDKPTVPNPRAEAKPRQNEEAVAIMQLSICERANKGWSGDTSTRRVYMYCLIILYLELITSTEPSKTTITENYIY